MAMSWGECTVEFGDTGANDSLSTSLESVGVIKEKSTVLDHADGEELKAYATGHKLVGYEEQDGDLTLKTRIIEPSLSLIAAKIGADYSGGVMTANTMVVEADQSVKVTPKNSGGKGITIRKSKLKVRTGWSEEEGFFADFTFTCLVCADGELLQYFEKP